jgi:hypothetical protein
MTTKTLENGIVIAFANNKSGYAGVSYTPKWTLDETHPFVASITQPKNKAEQAEVTTKLTHSVHLGYYDDARKAAYVIGLYRANPVKTLKQYRLHGAFKSFPTDLFALPVPSAEVLAQPSKGRAKRINPVIVDYDVPAKNNLNKFFDYPLILSIVELFDSVNEFQDYLTGLTIKQFANEFQINFREGASNV